mgnify:FL=1|tara:strand:+ start:571 stop:1881 length:1311 start_codon:yes stop_codon:yes gene_type:complete
MAIFKQFNTNEVVKTPFGANKRFAYSSSQVSASDVGIEYYQGLQGTYTSGSNPTGFTSILDKVLVFNSVKQLYYSNYLTASTGDNLPSESLVPGANPSFNRNVGITTGPRFDNFLQSSVTQSRFFSQFSASTAINGPSLISIPSKLFGERIPPGQFQFEYTSSDFTHSLVKDDSEGNLLAQQTDGAGGFSVTHSVGQIFYSQGIAVLTGGQDDPGQLRLLGSQVGYDGNMTSQMNSSSIQFSSSITIRENQYKCVIRDNEFSYTTNPSSLRPSGEVSAAVDALLSSIDITGVSPGNGTYTFIGSGAGASVITTVTGTGTGLVLTVVIADNVVSSITATSTGRGYSYGDVVTFPGSLIGGNGTVTITFSLGNLMVTTFDQNPNEVYYDFCTGSIFSPYITQIGLYNEAAQLVVVGRLSNAIPISLTTDTTFVINFDT